MCLLSSSLLLVFPVHFELRRYRVTRVNLHHVARFVFSSYCVTARSAATRLEALCDNALGPCGLPGDLRRTAEHSSETPHDACDQRWATPRPETDTPSSLSCVLAHLCVAWPLLLLILQMAHSRSSSHPEFQDAAECAIATHFVLPVFFL